MKNKYGCIGFVSLLGFWGLFGKEPLFLSFFAFILFFEYFWITPDEMFIETMRKCAAIAFFTNLAITVTATIILSQLKISSNALSAGMALGFGASIAVFALLVFVMELKERIVAKHD